MFVSSYNTFVQVASSQKTDKLKSDSVDTSSEKFSTKLSEQISSISSKTSTSPITNKYKQQNLHTKQALSYQQNENSNPTKEVINKFNGQNTLINAKSSYESNSKMFSLVKSTSFTLNQTPSLTKTLPKEPMEIKEANMRYKMINTYIANDNYFRITA